MPDLVKCWEPVIEKRTELSPLLVAMQSEVGGLNKFVHIWPFSSWEQRSEIKGNKNLEGIWPPQGEGAIPVSQENMIMLPTPFSPMQ